MSSACRTPSPSRLFVISAAPKTKLRSETPAETADISRLRPLGKIDYRNSLQRLITGKSYRITQGGFWGNGAAIHQSGIISPGIAVGM